MYILFACAEQGLLCGRYVMNNFGRAGPKHKRGETYLTDYFWIFSTHFPLFLSHCTFVYLEIEFPGPAGRAASHGNAKRKSLKLLYFQVDFRRLLSPKLNVVVVSP